MTWANNVISAPFIGKEKFQTLRIKALVLGAMNRTPEADSIIDMSIHHPTATVSSVHHFGWSLISQGRNRKALEVFQRNHEMHPEE